MSENTVTPASLDYQAPSAHALDPLKDGISSLELVRVSGSDLDIVNAARVSYAKKSTAISERDKTLVGFLMKHMHTSPFEHNQLSFRVKCPIFTARQWMRHRTSSYNEISYRYVKAPLEFYIPNQWRQQDKVNKQMTVAPFENDELRKKYQESLAQSAQTYEMLLEQGVGRELARGVLPMCTYTEFIYTVNLHSLMHFLKLRMHAGAQHEIRAYAECMLELALPHFPIALQAWKETHMPELLKMEEKLSTVLS